MLARGALCRSAASTTRARFLQRTRTAPAASFKALRAVLRAYSSAFAARRSYATTTAATKPTATVKKAVKANAAAKSPPKKRAIKAAAPKTGAKAKATPRARARVKPAAKKAPKKAAPKKRVAKVLTPEQQERATARKDRARRVELRATALKAPARRALSAFQVFVGEESKGKTGEGPQSARLVAASQKWKSLPASEHEHYNHLARERNAAMQAEYKAWVLSHTPQEIHAANLARNQLRRLSTAKKQPANTEKIVDGRHVKRQLTSYNLFFTERIQSGDFKGIIIADAARLIGQEFKALSAGEKKKYEDEAAADKERVTREKAAQA